MNYNKPIILYGTHSVKSIWISTEDKEIPAEVENFSGDLNVDG
jgi:hypothetical protein